MTETRTKLCSCGCSRAAVKRGLSNTCYKRAVRCGELDTHKRSVRPAAETVSMWIEMRSDGLTVEVAAERLGVTAGSLKATIRRHEARTGECIGYAPPDPKLIALRSQLADWYNAGCRL
jgi:hypothetical protein